MSNSFVKEADFSGKSVAVLGFGVEGRSVCDFLISREAKITVLDEVERGSFEDEMVREYEEKGVVFEYGPFSELETYDVVVRSPGISVRRDVVKNASKRGVLVTSATKLFFDLCPAQIIGVSGSKGKGTTSSLIFEMLKRAGKDVHLAGNIGEPMLDLLPSLTPDSIVVLELSSFQLSDLHKSPHIAVLLMIVPEHLDYHADFSEYLEAKRNLVRFQTTSDFAIFNQDSPPSNESDMVTVAHILQVSREGSVLEGCWVEKDALYIRLDGKKSKIVSVDEIRLVGKHNLENACAAALVARILNVGEADIAWALGEFGGLEHRLELVRALDGVSYYNDSFSTIPETTIAAIEALIQPKVLILGGSGKKSDFEELGRVISEANVRGIVGIGDEWSRIKPYIKSKKIEIVEGKKTMREIVGAACEMAQAGDVVLLSPACASFGMFSNYKDRGNQFKQCVMQIA